MSDQHLEDHLDDHLDDEPDDVFDPFLDAAVIRRVLRPVKGGKEATVWLCEAGRAAAGHRLLAAKVYRSRERRNFRHDAVYKEGRVIIKRRLRVAVEKRTRFGRQLDEAWWVGREHEALTRVGAAGADVPKVLAGSEHAVLMAFIGDEEGPAPQLQRVELDAGRARSMLDRLLWNVELFLRHDLVHADLSPFNVLVWEGRPVLIDLPQAVDARTNPNAPALLLRDLNALVRHFRRYGIDDDPEAIARDLWSRYLFATL